MGPLPHQLGPGIEIQSWKPREDEKTPISRMTSRIDLSDLRKSNEAFRLSFKL